jgi:hypothetical protein
VAIGLDGQQLAEVSDARRLDIELVDLVDQTPGSRALIASPLDRPRRPDAARIGVKQQRDHHRWLVGRPAATVLANGRIALGQIHSRDGVQHEPREMPLRQPVTDVRRRQERLLTITRDEALAHRTIVLNPRDDYPTYATASGNSTSGPQAAPSM